ncbi:MAG: accessory factor UbiK family protein [Pseudomonadota bacterium]
MNTSNKIFDDISQLATNAMGVAKGAADEAQTAFNSWVDRWLAERDLVTREEFDAMKTMVEKQRKEITALKGKVTKLEKGAS